MNSSPISGLPPTTPLTREQLDAYRPPIAALFNSEWLKGSNGHRLQKLWQRNDHLASLELAGMGYAIEALLPLHQRWLQKCARTIRNQPDGCHGHIFEIMILGALTAGGADVTPMPASHPGFDALVTLEGGQRLEISIKNHDISKYESEFKKNCEALHSAAIRRFRGSPCPWSLLAGSTEAMDSRDFQKMHRALDRINFDPSAKRHYRIDDGKMAIDLGPLLFENILNQSYQIIVRSPSNALEQTGFEGKLKKSIANLLKHGTKNDSTLKIIIMRVHSTANAIALALSARQILQNEHDSIDAILFFQASVVNTKSSNSISYFMPEATTARFKESGIKINLAPLIGRRSSNPSALQLQSSDGFALDVTGQYLYQRGHLYVRGKIGDSIELSAPGPGIHTSAVVEISNEDVIFTARRPDDDELYIL